MDTPVAAENQETASSLMTSLFTLQRPLALGSGIHLDLGSRRSPVLPKEGDLSLIIECIFSSLFSILNAMSFLITTPCSF